MTRNSVHDGCVGMYVDPGVGATITYNHVFDNNECELPGFNYGRGVTLAGARGTVVKHNVIEGHTAADGLPAVLVTDDVGTGNAGTGTVASDNVISHNRIVDNSLDLVSTATGKQPHRPQRVHQLRPSRPLPLTASCADPGRGRVTRILADLRVGRGHHTVECGAGLPDRRTGGAALTGELSGRGTSPSGRRGALRAARC